MKNLLIATAAVATLGLTACQTAPKVDNKAPIVKNGEVKEVTVKPISSFLIEISPRKALCDSVNGGKIECLQYRNRYQSNFNPLKTEIAGFTYEPGFSYILDVKQDTVDNTATGQKETKWSLNRIVSKSAAPLSN